MTWFIVLIFSRKGYLHNKRESWCSPSVKQMFNWASRDTLVFFKFNYFFWFKWWFFSLKQPCIILSELGWPEDWHLISTECLHKLSFKHVQLNHIARNKDNTIWTSNILLHILEYYYINRIIYFFAILCKLYHK